jgi:hypothetical protein
MRPALDERDRIRAAMDRIFDGTPERSNGALTIVALALALALALAIAIEAGVPQCTYPAAYRPEEGVLRQGPRPRRGTPESGRRHRLPHLGVPRRHLDIHRCSRVRLLGRRTGSPARRCQRTRAGPWPYVYEKIRPPCGRAPSRTPFHGRPPSTRQPDPRHQTFLTSLGQQSAGAGKAVKAARSVRVWHPVETG